MPPRNKLIASVLMVLLLLGSGTISFHLIEKWSLVDSLYFTVVTLSTIGYGDLSPVTVQGRIFTIFFIIAGVGTFLLAIATIAEYSMQSRIHKFDDSLMNIKQAVENVASSGRMSSKGLIRHTRRHLRKMAMPLRGSKVK
jgi:voltage-gated potassium channel